MSNQPISPSALGAALQEFLTGLRDWITGSIPDDDVVFEERLGSGMHPDVAMVMPSGAALGYDDWVTAVRESHGSNPAFDFRLTDVRAVVVDGNLGVVTCNEWQLNAITGPGPLNGRVTTVVYRRSDEGLRMLHVQQTWLPREVVRAELEGG